MTGVSPSVGNHPPHDPPSPSISRSVAQEIPLTKVHTRFLRHSAPFPNATSSISKDTTALTLMRSTRACEPPPDRGGDNRVATAAGTRAPAAGHTGQPAPATPPSSALSSATGQARPPPRSPAQGRVHDRSHDAQQKRVMALIGPTGRASTRRALLNGEPHALRGARAVRGGEAGK